jgi:hypothetical protein
MALAETSFFYNLMFTLRWLIQQCLSAQHEAVGYPLCIPFVNPLYLQDYFGVAKVLPCVFGQLSSFAGVCFFILNRLTLRYSSLFVIYSLLLVLYWTYPTRSFLPAGKGVLRFWYQSGFLFLKQRGEWFSLPA